VAIEKARGVIIRLSDYSETSQVVTFLTDAFGKVSAIAKGAKRAKSSTGGALDMLTLNEIVFSESPSGGLATLREARALEQFPGLRAATERYYAGLYFAELAGIFGEGTEGTSEHFDLLVASLAALSAAAVNVGNITAYFESHLLTASGLAPNLTRCARCGAGLQRNAAARLSLADGGLLCPKCPGGTAIGKGSLATLRRLFSSSVQGVSRLRMPKAIQSDVSGLLSAFIVYNARRVPRLSKYVKPALEAQWRKWAGPTEVQST